MTVFASTSQIVTDPNPFVRPRDGKRGDADTLSPDFEPGPFGKMVEPLRYDPRPEYGQPQIHEANPILVELRIASGAGIDWAITAFSNALNTSEQSSDAIRAIVREATDEHRDHARRVIDRLAQLRNRAAKAVEQDTPEELAAAAASAFDSSIRTTAYELVLGAIRCDREARERYQVIAHKSGLESLMGAYATKFEADAIAKEWNRVNSRHGITYRVEDDA